MPSKFGGVPVEETGSKFGGIPYEEPDAPVIRFDLPTEAELEDKFWRAKEAGDEQGAAAAFAELKSLGATLGQKPAWVRASDRQKHADSLPAHQQFFGAAGGRAIRMGRGAGQLAELATAGFAPTPYAQSQAERDAVARTEDEQAAFDAPLNSTGWGMAGDFGAQVAPLAAGAIGLRGTSAASMFMPRTFSGSLVQGAVIGGAQSTGMNDSRLMNMGLGALGGGGGYGAMKAVGGLAGLMRGDALPLTHRSMENAAGRVIRRSATNPAALANEAPSAIPGVQRTLAEETLDPGIAQLQRQFPVQLAEQAAQNNAARAAAIRAEFRGADDAAISAIEQTRDAEAKRALRGLRSKTDIAVQPVTKALDAMLAKQKGRPAVQTALRFVKEQMESGISNADEAYNVRKTIGDLMEGRLSGDLAAASAAKQELLLVRGLLDRQMRTAVPTWGEYLRGYKAASREADQARVGKTLLDRGATATENASTGERMLTPAKVSGLTNDQNRLVQSATGFRKATAERTLTPEQRALIGNVREDLSRVETAQNAGRAVGSPTAQNQGTLAQLGAIVSDTVPMPAAARRMVNRAASARQDYVNEQVAALLANPAKAREVLARMPPKQRNEITEQLRRMVGPVAASVVLSAPQE